MTTDLRFIENSGPNTLGHVLPELVRTATWVDIQTAFVTTAGIRDLMPLLQTAAQRGRVRFLTGFYQRFTEPRALNRLLAAQRRLGDAFQVRVSRDLTFHRKFYAGGTTRRGWLVLGSANLTKDGLERTGELSCLLTFKQGSTLDHRIGDLLDRQWEPARPLDTDLLREYEKQWAKAQRALTPPLSSLRLLLGRAPASIPPSKDFRVQKTREPRCWVDWYQGWLKPETDAALSKSTDWDRRGATWFSEYSSRRYRRGDLILRFDLGPGRREAELAVVLDETHLALHNGEGPRFIAYRRLPRTTWRLASPRLRKNLRTAGLECGRDFRVSKPLPKATWQSLAPLFRSNIRSAR